MYSWLSLLLLCCSPAQEMGLDDSRTDPSPEDVTETADSGLMDSGQQLPSWWTMGASLSVVEGVPDAKASTLTLSVLDDALLPYCDATAAVASATALDPPHPDVFAWWALTWEPAVGCEGILFPLPENVLLGVGAMHPEVLARLTVADVPAPAMLNGAYTSLDSLSTLLVYGAAGQPAAWKGKAGPVDLALPDGTWTIAPVFSFELSP